MRTEKAREEVASSSRIQRFVQVASRWSQENAACPGARNCGPNRLRSDRLTGVDAGGSLQLGLLGADAAPSHNGVRDVIAGSVVLARDDPEKS